MERKSKDFKALQAKWYAKLEKKGFVDIEQKNGRLKTYDGLFFHTQLGKKGQSFFEAKEEYYRRAGQFLHEYQFETPFAKQVWALHADGYGIREIVDYLKQKGIKTYRRAVHELLQGLTKELLAEHGG